MPGPEASSARSRHWLRRWVPDEERLRSSVWLRWMGPVLHRPGLWQINRRSVALGAGLGVFFGFLIPVAQILGAALLAVVLRANLPVAAAATLVSNPLTYAPIGIAAYRTGTALLGKPEHPGADKAIADAVEGESDPVSTPGWWERMRHIGKPLFLGLAVFAVVGGVSAWLLVHAGWTVAIWLRRRRRRAQRRA